MRPQIGAAVGLEPDVRQKDRYSRTLAPVWPAEDAVTINEQLLAEGYAMLLTTPPDVRYVDRFATAQQTARDAGLGLWTACPEPHKGRDDGLFVDGPPIATETAKPTMDPLAPPMEPATAIPTTVPLAPPIAPPAAMPTRVPAGPKPSANCSQSNPDFCIPTPQPA
jgi:hypothetical protein